MMEDVGCALVIPNSYNVGGDEMDCSAGGLDLLAPVPRGIERRRLFATVASVRGRGPQ